MTFSTNVPDASQSPALFPAQANVNFARLQTIIDANHKFNDTAASDDGYHQNVQMLPLATPGNLPAAGQLFANTAVTNNPLTYKDTGNNVWQVSPCLPLRAAVVFSPGSPGTILYSYNVSSVSRNGGGLYQVNFTSSIPTANYYWSLNIVPNSSSNAINATARTSVSPAAGSFQIAARAADGSANDNFVSICALFYGG